jgi:hypothetical protein
MITIHQVRKGVDVVVLVNADHVPRRGETIRVINTRGEVVLHGTVEHVHHLFADAHESPASQQVEIRLTTIP